MEVWSSQKVENTSSSNSPIPIFADENGAAIKSRPTQYSIVKKASKSFIVCPVSAQIKSIIIGLSEVPPGYAVGFQFIWGNGDETQNIMEAFADIMFAFRGSSEWFADWIGIRQHIRVEPD